MSVIVVSRVMMDAGHGGDQPGNVNFGVREKDSTLSLTLKVKHYAQLYSWSAQIKGPLIKGLMTRQDDRHVGIHKRADMARAEGCNAFVSIHTNSHINVFAKGAEAFVAVAGAHRYTSIQLGARILDELRAAGLAKRGVKDDSKSQHTGGLGVLRGTIDAMDSVLVEVGFASNLHDRRVICSPTGKEMIAMAIARAIVSHFGLDPAAGAAAFAASPAAKP